MRIDVVRALLSVACMVASVSPLEAYFVTVRNETSHDLWMAVYRYDRVKGTILRNSASKYLPAHGSAVVGTVRQNSARSDYLLYAVADAKAVLPSLQLPPAGVVSFVIDVGTGEQNFKLMLAPEPQVVNDQQVDAVIDQAVAIEQSPVFDEVSEVAVVSDEPSISQ